jgi:hypothetical protein
MKHCGQVVLRLNLYMIGGASTLQRNRLKSKDRYVHYALTIGPHSRPNNLVKIDGRTKEAQLMRRVREELTRHVGGNPSAIQRALIERCTWLSLKISMLDRKIAAGREFTQIDSNTYLAWSNTLTRTLARLGDPAKSNTSASSLTSILAELGHDGAP